MRTTIYILRHGETDDNRSGILQGQTPGCLNANGWLQAAAAAGRLRGLGLTRVYCSDLHRAKQTLEGVLPLDPAHIELEPALRERAFGEFQGKTWEEYRTAISAAGCSELDFKPNGGESQLDLRLRMQKFWDSMVRSCLGENILLISHGGTIRHLLGLAQGDPLMALDRQVVVSNTSLSCVEVDGNAQGRIVYCNDTTHLSDAGIEVKVYKPI